MNTPNITPCKVNVASETGRLRAVLLRRPGIEIERMTPLNAAQALYSDILDKPTVDNEYGLFSGVLERWCTVYHVQDILEVLLKDNDIRQHLVIESLRHDRRTSQQQQLNDGLTDYLMGLDSTQLARVLIEGYEKDFWDGFSDDRYLLKPLYNLLFTRDASSTIYDRVLINSMSFEVRERESMIYEAIFRHFFGAEILNVAPWNPLARTEGGDIHIASPDLLCIGEGIRTNAKGIDYLAQKFAHERDHFNILVQEMPMEPDSFIHLDMVFTPFSARVYGFRTYVEKARHLCEQGHNTDSDRQWKNHLSPGGKYPQWSATGGMGHQTYHLRWQRLMGTTTRAMA